MPRAPVLSATARQTYLQRKLDSFDFLKAVPKAELLAHAHEQGMRFATENWQHQLVCFVIGMMCREFLFFLKQSGGKSKIILDLIRYRLRTRELQRALILVPELLHVESWEEQIKTHAPDLTYQLAVGEKSKRSRILTKQGTVVVMNYAGLQMFMTEHRKMRGEDKAGNEVVRGKQVIVQDKAAHFMIDHGFNFCTIDEVHRIVDMTSTYYNLFRWCMAACDFKYALTGSAFGKDPTPLFGQFLLVDDGATLGRSLGMLHHVFFTPKPHPFKGVEYSFDKTRTADLNRIIKHRSITYEVTEYKDMPRKLPIRIPLRLRGEGLAFYQRILAGIKELRGDYRSLGSAYIRMRQCCSGFISLKADDESRIEVQFADNPKLEALRDFIASRDEKMLVFHEFKVSAGIIEKMFEGERLKWAAIRGGTRDIGAEYKRFLQQDSCKVFLLNNQLGSEAINPQYVCRRAVFYESPADPKRRDQAEMRVWRQGQPWTVFLNDLLMLGTIEEKILRNIRQGRNLYEAIMSGDESLIEDDEEQP